MQMCAKAVLLSTFLFILGGCQTTDVCGTTKDDLNLILHEVRKRELEYDEVLWLLSVNEEWGTATAWIGHIRQGVLFANKLSREAGSSEFVLQAQRAYSGIRTSRLEALCAVFMPQRLWEDKSDHYWRSSIQSFAGRGSHFQYTLVPLMDDDVQYVASSISSTDELLSVDSRRPIPLELALPWLLSRYYSAERPETPTR
jgi:hypothetical protein